MPPSSRQASAAGHSAPSSSSPVRDDGAADGAGGAGAGVAPRTYCPPDPSSTEPAGFKPYVLGVGPSLFGYDAPIAACASARVNSAPAVVRVALL
jgi:hypothetical protein